MEQLVAKRLLIDALKKADEENQGSNLVSKREFLKKKLDIIIQHFPETWREVVNEDAALYYTFFKKFLN